jgi:hypothetical protein
MTHGVRLCVVCNLCVQAVVLCISLCPPRLLLCLAGPARATQQHVHCIGIVLHV